VSGDRPIGALSRVRVIRVGTENAAKLAAVRSVFADYLEDVEVLGVRVGSGVSEQPVGLGEIVAGARNRAHAALRAGPCQLAVGIEDGLAPLPSLGLEGVGTSPDAALNIGAAVVTDGERDEIGLSAAFAYPPDCLEDALAHREPIGALFDARWNAYVGSDDLLPSGRSIGNIGKLSLGALTRSEYGRHAVVCALLPFLHPGLYATPVSDSTSARTPGSVDE